MSLPASITSRREFIAQLAQAGIAVSVAPHLFAQNPPAAATDAVQPVILHPGPWQFQLPKGSIILVSDQQLEDLTDPDREVDLSLSATPNRTTLRRLCEEQRNAGSRTLILAFDEFWSQYRAGQNGKPRVFTPDTEAYLQRIAKIGVTLKQYGLGFELSLLSPLEIGAGYALQTGESGRWVHYREGWRDPATGRYSVGLWEQLRWTNNKGTVELKRTGIRVFAFRERRLGRSSLYAVDPGDLVELNQPPVLEAAEAAPRARARRLVVRGEGDAQAGPRDRVLVVVSYAVPEMDYFSPRALPFLEDLVRRYHAAGVPLNGSYADEMHIQQDWGYADHHEEGQFALRFLSPNLARRFAEKFGGEYADLEKWLVYFCYGQHGFYPNLEARLAAQHVVGGDPADVQRTFLLRRRYYQLLHETVVDLFATAKAAAEKLYEHPLESRAHATWAQSPTIDFWNTRNQPLPPRQYEYTPDFLWSNTVQQAASACSDYFKWNDFLTGGGNDHAEGGWSDRNYYGLALACSTGSLNPVPNAYAAAWGMPNEALARHRHLENAFGCSPDPAFAAVTDYQHREVPVLMLYPSSLVACEERFGSWMVQYGYANYVTPEKFLEHARVLDDGALDLAGRRYRTLVVLFEPLPPAGLLAVFERFVARGGQLIWSGPPPRFDLSGAAVLDSWQRLFGLRALLTTHEGIAAAGSRVSFSGRLAAVPPQTILTDFLVDLTYPVEPETGREVVARCRDQVIGTARAGEAGGAAIYLGFRPRDDQAASLGEEVRTWFEILRAVGAYRTARPDCADDPSVLSRTTPHLVTRFPNGTTAVAAHYRSHVESWPGGFHREADKDAAILAANPLPSDELDLRDLAILGRRVAFRGRGVVMFRNDATGGLLAFAGSQCDRIRLDDHEHVLSDRPLAFLAWAPVHASRRVAKGAILELWVLGEGQLRIPCREATETARLVRAGGKPGLPGEPVAARIQNGVLEVTAGPAGAQGHHYLLAPGA